MIWFTTPVPYEETHLDDQLVADLAAWDRSYYTGLTPDLSSAAER